MKLATQIFLCVPKSDFADVKKIGGDGYGAAKMYVVVMTEKEMHMVC
jgi:hypothetical protein